MCCWITDNDLIASLSRFIVDIDDPEIQRLVEYIPSAEKISCWMKLESKNEPILLPFQKLRSPVEILEQLPLYYQKGILELAKSEFKEKKQQAIVALYLFQYALPMIHEVENKQMKPKIYLRTKPRPTENPKQKTTGYLSILNQTTNMPAHYELVFVHR